MSTDPDCLAVSIGPSIPVQIKASTVNYYISTVHKQMENLTLSERNLCCELQELNGEATSSSYSQPTDGEKACVLRYFEHPLACVSPE